MNTGRVLCAVCLSTVLAMAGSAYGTWTWSQLDYPGATTTYAYGVDGSTIVGSYLDAAGQTHGFARDAGGWRTLDYPGAAYTHVSAVSASKMVGYYKDASNNSHGFLYDGTSWETLDYAGALDTYPRGISGDHIVGTYDFYPWPSNTHGFALDGGNWTTLPQSHYPSGVSASKVVGRATNAQGFVYDGIAWTYLQYPAYLTGSGMVFDTNLVGISGSNIIGNATWAYYPYLDMYNRAFLYNGSTWQTLNYPGSVSDSTYAWGISGSGVVGSYADANGSHVFLLTIPEPTTLTLLGVSALGALHRRRRP